MRAEVTDQSLVSTFDARIEGQRLLVNITADASCRLRLRLFTKSNDEVTERIIAELNVEVGTAMLAIEPAPDNAYSIILDVSGREFHHRPLT